MSDEKIILREVYTFPCVITYDSLDTCYNVEFPDLPGCLTWGDTLEEALDNAQEALEGYILVCEDLEREIPVPGSVSPVLSDNQKLYMLTV